MSSGGGRLERYDQVLLIGTVHQGLELAVGDARQHIQVDRHDGLEPVPVLEAVLAGDHVLGFLQEDLRGADLSAGRLSQPRQMLAQPQDGKGLASGPPV